MTFEFNVEKEINLKEFLLENNFSKRTVSRLLLEKKNVFINGVVYGKDFLLHVGDKVRIVQEEETKVLPKEGKLDVVFEDDLVLVVNKPSGIAVIPSKAHYEDNLSSTVLAYLNKKGEKASLHVVNRLDLSTAGLVVFAKSGHVHSLISNAKITKKYLACVDGLLEKKVGTINYKIKKSSDGIKREVSSLGKTAITEYKVLKEKNGKSLVDISLKTGRTHQIRVHFSYIGHPLCGDTLYGKSDLPFFLCSYYLAFGLPSFNKNYVFSLENTLDLGNLL